MAETKLDASLADQPSAAATPLEPSSVLTSNVEKCADVNEPTSNSAEEPDTRQYRPTAHDDTDIDIIWHNVYADSDFVTFRKRSDGPIERILTDFASVIEANIFEEVISVNASKYQFTVVVACSKQWDEVSKWVAGVL